MSILRKVKNNIISQLSYTEEELSELVKNGKLNPVVYHTAFSKNMIRDMVANRISDARKYGALYDREQNNPVSSVELEKMCKLELLKIEVEIAEHFENIGQQRNFTV